MASLISPLWRWIITDLDGSTLTFLDKLASNRRIEWKLQEPSQMTGDVASDSPEINILHTDGDPFLAEGNRQIYGLRRESDTPPYYVCRMNGIILQVNDAAQQDDARTAFTAYDPWQYLYSVPALQSISAYIGDPDTGGATTTPGTSGELIDERGIVYPPSEDLSLIAYDVLNTAVIYGFLDGSPPAASDDCYIDRQNGTYESCGGPAPPGFAIQQYTSVGQVFADLVATGRMDIVLEPIYDPSGRPGILAVLNVYQMAGTWNDDAIFAWDKPGRSLVGIDRLQDGSQRANIVQFYNGQGGPPVARQFDTASIAKYGGYWAQQAFPAQIAPGPVIDFAAYELFLRKDRKKMVSIHPAPERSPEPFVDYTLGDRVPIYAGHDQFREELSGYQRIMEVPIDLDDNGVETVRELIVGPAAELPVAMARMGTGKEGISVAMGTGVRAQTRRTTSFRTGP